VSAPTPPEDDLTPPEARVRGLLADLRARQPAAPGLGGAVSRRLRWQRPLRHAFQAMGVTGGGIAAGLGHALRGRRRS
jgi:hypothetical protein